jgi:hypothetical protein
MDYKIVSGCIIGLFIIYGLYLVFRNDVENYVILDKGTLNDCLNSCTADDKCTSIMYGSGGVCMASKSFDEHVRGLSYIKRSKASGDVYIDPGQREYHVTGTNNIKVINWD